MLLSSVARRPSVHGLLMLLAGKQREIMETGTPDLSLPHRRSDVCHFHARSTVRISQWQASLQGGGAYKRAKACL